MGDCMLNIRVFVISFLVSLFFTLSGADPESSSGSWASSQLTVSQANIHQEQEVVHELLQDSKYLRSLGQTALQYYFRDSREKLHPFVAAQLHKKLQGASSREEFKRSAARLRRSATPDSPHLTSRRKSQDQMDDVMMKLLADSFEDAFNEYEKRIVAMEHAISAQKEKLKHEIKRRKAQEKKRAVLMNTVTGLITTALAAIVTAYASKDSA